MHQTLHNYAQIAVPGRQHDFLCPGSSMIDAVNTDACPSPITHDTTSSRKQRLQRLCMYRLTTGSMHQAQAAAAATAMQSTACM
jgi:hypothetical protein